MTRSGCCVPAASADGSRVEVVLARIVLGGQSPSSCLKNSRFSGKVLRQRLDDQVDVRDHRFEVSSCTNVRQRRVDLRAGGDARLLHQRQLALDGLQRLLQPWLSPTVEVDVKAPCGKVQGDSVPHKARAKYGNRANLSRVHRTSG